MAAITTPIATGRTSILPPLGQRQPQPPLPSPKALPELAERPQVSAQNRSIRRKPSKPRLARVTTSTPNLNSLYTAHSKRPAVPPLPTRPGLHQSRKVSLAASTLSHRLASAPDDSDSHTDSDAVNLSADISSRGHTVNMVPSTPSRSAGADDVKVGDVVDVPGNMYGTVRFVGSVAGRKGTFAGVELASDFPGRGKNNGDVDGISYFTTSLPGTGIFVPISKLLKPTYHQQSIPATPTSIAALRLANQNTTNHGSNTPSLRNFSLSMGPNRNTSPNGKRPGSSLARPESPVRKLQLQRTPAAKPATASPTKALARYDSPTPGRLGTDGRDTGKTPSRLGRRPSMAPPRSTSVLGQTSTSSHHNGDEALAALSHVVAAGGAGLRMRPGSRAAHAHEEEMERLRAQLEDRDRQLKDQATALAEMENSVAELTSLMEETRRNGRGSNSDSLGDKDTSQLRALLREKNEKVATLTAEFDAHRADFRSTIDTLELASTETQRVYDSRIQELEHQLLEYRERTEDVHNVALQLRHFDNLVQELEEGLEDARRGEAEARGEVEFLRGEVERTRSELKRERDKASATTNGGRNGANSSSLSKELEKKEDEIRGLKAIIHSLSRDASMCVESLDVAQSRKMSALNLGPDAVGVDVAKGKLEGEIDQLRGLVVNKTKHEEELEREIEMLRRGSATTVQGDSTGNFEEASYRDSRATGHEHHPSAADRTQSTTLETMAESDAYSSFTENSTLWCDMCEASGHDILNCTSMFGSQKAQGSKSAAVAPAGQGAGREERRHLTVPRGSEGFVPRPLTPSRSREAAPPSPPAKDSPKGVSNAGDFGPLAGKESRCINLDKWCALCERDGHDSIDCPLEDMF